MTDGILSAMRDWARPATFCWSVDESTLPSNAFTTMSPEAWACAGKYLAATWLAWTDS